MQHERVFKVLAMAQAMCSVCTIQISFTDTSVKWVTVVKNAGNLSTNQWH